ncbi:hypothetical protein MKW94_026037 [Papaver nudicaule]|uniref:lysine--tRNA ligase n=1 Tax=Papaver nudicaule TaxID=74823 RepID=A0AA41VWQ3_PAPNU|nr:hypothetical protein [Papaver nudicaule]
MHINSFGRLADIPVEEETQQSEEEEFPNSEAAATTARKSKSAMKRQRRKQRKNESNSLKEEEEKSKLNNPEAAAAADEDDTDPNARFRENRIKMVESLKESGFNPYPHKFKVTMTIPAFINMYKTMEAGEHRKDVVVSLSGRIMEKRMQSPMLICYDLCGLGGLEVQLVVDASNSVLDVAEFTNLHSGVERGDIVGVTGFPGMCNGGELSLFPGSFVVLCNTLQLIPMEKADPGGDNSNVKKCDLWIPGSTRNPGSYILKDQETRYRQRYLDLMLNKEVPQIFITRAKVVSYIRRFLEDLHFLEVETPLMNMIAGGATTKPFVTHRDGLNMNLLKRVPPELYLKQLLVGGFERVFEIGKFFRNDPDLAHNPEFATCEFYEAYADYYDLMDRTEKMLSGMVQELTGGYKIKYHANGFDKDPIEIDFTPPFRKIDMMEELEKAAGLEIPSDLSSDKTNKCLLDACRKFDVNCPPQTTERLLYKVCLIQDQGCGKCAVQKLQLLLVEHFLGETCVNPTFIIDHPAIMRPLGKSHRLKLKSKLGLTEGFQLFINKLEVCHGYTELNDPMVQRQQFAEQLKDGVSAVEEAYCKALEYGLPPTAGWGLEIDHLTMLFTDSQNIKVSYFDIVEVIMFPAMKPQDEPAPQAQSNNAPVNFIGRQGWISITSFLVSFILCMFLISRFFGI